MQIYDKYNLLNAKPIPPLLSRISALSEIFPDAYEYSYQDGIRIKIPDIKSNLAKPTLQKTKSSIKSTSKTTSKMSSKSTLVAKSCDKNTQNPYYALESLALDLRSWRKGPFFLGDLHIDSEWQSFIKWDLLLPHILKENLLENAIVGDIGCNNGFYLFAMSLHKPRLLVGFDPSALFFCQFCFINHFLGLPIFYELLGVQDLGEYLADPKNALKSCVSNTANIIAKYASKTSKKPVTQNPATRAKNPKFDVLFCLGVLYHRADVFSTLKSLSNALDSGGVAFVDTLVVEMQDFLGEGFLEKYIDECLDEVFLCERGGKSSKSNSAKKIAQKIAKNATNKILDNLSNTEFVLCPKKSYAKMPNVFFIPSVRAFEGWAQRCGFDKVELLAIVPTTTDEQRHTKWITSLSLESFLDKEDFTKTIEGYPAPKRAYFKLRRK
ncbi:DUF1698 domain-containing protein [Helicobacter sp. T3_23-1059]